MSASKITIPDFESHCDSSFVLRTNKEVTTASPSHDAWLLAGLGDIPERKKEAYAGLKAGLLTSMCYPDAPLEQLQVCCDFVCIDSFTFISANHFFSDWLLSVFCFSLLIKS
jgi:hypothetical protein